MEICDCKFVLSARGVKVDDILESRSMPHTLIPDLDELLAAALVEHYPYSKSFEEAKDDPYMIVHTGGSTGFPKPVRWTLGGAAVHDATRNLAGDDEVSGRRRDVSFCHPGPQRMLVPFLHFHGVASLGMMIAVVYGRAIYVNGFRHKILERSDLIPVLEHSNVDVAILSPAMVEDLVVHPEAPKYLSKMSRIFYGGGRFLKSNL